MPQLKKEGREGKEALRRKSKKDSEGANRETG
jgi:hypothetical protein